MRRTRLTTVWPAAYMMKGWALCVLVSAEYHVLVHMLGASNSGVDSVWISVPTGAQF